MDDLDRIFDVPFTFSKDCRSGYLGDKCNCWRCRKSRNEPVTDETNALAEKEAKEIDKKIHEKVFLKDPTEGLKKEDNDPNFKEVVEFMPEDEKKEWLEYLDSLK